MQVLQEVTLFKNHGAAVGTWTIKAVSNCDELDVATSLREATAKLVIEHTKVIGGKSVISEVPVEGKNVGRANETTPDYQALAELESRVKKQLDKGYVRTEVEAAAPATNSLGLRKPMLAHPIDKVKPESIDWDNAYAQPKLDGHRCLTDGITYSRNGKAIELPHITEQLGDLGLLDKGLDGELYIHGMMLQDIGSLVKKPREESKQLEYHLYDIISPAPYAERLEMLTELLAKATDTNIRLVHTQKVGSRAELMDLHGSWKADKYEGSILRHGVEGYQADKRSASLLKVKDFDEAEFTVIGVERGTPNKTFDEDGNVTGVFEVPVWTCANPNGLTDETKTFTVTAQGNMQQKHAQWQLSHLYMGRQLTVQHFDFSKDQVPLLPVALRWREDV